MKTPKNAAPVSMAEIARRADVSVATVSLSLRNEPSIPPATRQRIAALARRLGYRPHPYLSALMRCRRQGRPLSHRPVLAIVCALETADAWRNAPSPIRRAIFAGAMERASELGYQGQEFWLHQQGMSPARFSEMLRARGIPGVILGPRPDGAAPPALRWEYFSAVTLSVPAPTLPLPSVCHDHYQSALRAVHECHALGYRRPGLVMRRSHRDLFQGRLEAGFYAAQRAHPSLQSLESFLPDNLEESAAFPAGLFRRWLDRRRPDVLVTLSAPFLEAALGQTGRKAPADIGLVSLSCPDPNDRVSGIFQNGRLMGATGIDALVGLVERHEFGLPAHGLVTMLEGRWNPGRTLRSQA